jgi:cobalamin biosynthesis protein CobT
MAERMRTGVLGEIAPSAAEEETTEQVVALLRVFMKDSLIVAGRYAHGQRRNEVTVEDMRKGLMYCARTFFEQDGLEAKVEDERVEMGEEEDESGEEESGEEEGEEESGEEEGEEEGDADVEPDARDLQLVRHVDTIAQNWHLWQPEDPVHQLIKRAIDHT